MRHRITLMPHLKAFLKRLKRILGNEKNWQLIYTYDLSAHNAMIFGLTEAKMGGSGIQDCR